MKQELIYLACPYSHKEHYMLVARWLLVNKVAAKLMGQGKYVFSPISHTHPIAEAGKLPGDWNYWEGYDRRILSFCDRIIILKLPGWETSTGVNGEIKIGKNSNIPIEYMDYELTPTIDKVVEMAKAMENWNFAGCKTGVSSYDATGTCTCSTNV